MLAACLGVWSICIAEKGFLTLNLLQILLAIISSGSAATSGPAAYPGLQPPGPQPLLE